MPAVGQAAGADLELQGHAALVHQSVGSLDADDFGSSVCLDIDNEGILKSLGVGCAQSLVAVQRVGVQPDFVDDDVLNGCDAANKVALQLNGHGSGFHLHRHDACLISCACWASSATKHGYTSSSPAHSQAHASTGQFYIAHSVAV
jgi:hypothetical protein